MNDYLDELKKIKDDSNERFKIVPIQFEGVKGNERLINIANILKEYCDTENPISDVEQYYLFDFERIRKDIIRNNKRDLNKVEKIKIYIKNM